MNILGKIQNCERHDIEEVKVRKNMTSARDMDINNVRDFYNKKRIFRGTI